MSSHGRNPEEKTSLRRPVTAPSEDPLISTWVSLGYSALAAATAVRSPRIVVLSLHDLEPLLIGTTHHSRLRNRGKRHPSKRKRISKNDPVTALKHKSESL